MWQLGMSTPPILAMIVTEGLRDVNRVRILNRGEPGAHVYSHVARLDARRQPRSWFDVSSRPSRAWDRRRASPRVPALTPRVFERRTALRDVRLFRSLVGAVVALWAARDLVKIGFVTARPHSPAWTRARLHPVTQPRARAVARDAPSERRRATVETPRLPWRPRPPACAPPPKAQMSGRQPSDRRSVRATVRGAVRGVRRLCGCTVCHVALHQGGELSRPPEVHAAMLASGADMLAYSVARVAP